MPLSVEGGTLSALRQMRDGVWSQVRAGRRQARQWLRRIAVSALILRRQNGLFGTLCFTALSALGVRRVRTMRVCGESLRLRTASHDVVVAHETLCREFEDLDEIVDRRDDGLVIDAGGYIGTAAIRLAKMFPDATVVTLEPSRENIALLRENVARYPNIVVVNCALAGDASRGTLPLRDRKSGFWGFSIVEDINDGAEAAHMYNVDLITMPQLLRRFGATRVAFMKLDIEGAEREVLNASTAWIDCIDVLAIELHERFARGCKAAFNNATLGRENHFNHGGGEKHVSVRCIAPMAIAAE